MGIPITGLFLKTTTDFFSEKLLGLYERQRKKREEKGKRIFSAAAVFLVPGLIAFLFIPAAILTAIEVIIMFQTISRLRYFLIKMKHLKLGLELFRRNLF